MCSATVLLPTLPGRGRHAGDLASVHPSKRISNSEHYFRRYLRFVVPDRYRDGSREPPERLERKVGARAREAVRNTIET